MAALTGAEMKAAFEEIVDDTMPSDTLFYQLANLEKNLIETERMWEILVDLDETQSIGASHTFRTAISLPSRFLYTAAMYVGDLRAPMKQIPFAAMLRYQEAVQRYYIKRKDSTFFICGKPVSGSTIHHFYSAESADIASGVTWTFPGWAHMLIPIRLAKKFFAVDRGEKGRSWDDRWTIAEREIVNALVHWNHKLIKEAIKNGDLPVDYGSYSNVVG
jgi:hypothetical protein